jgi:uncharacterized protein (TIGR03083 family)
MTETTTDQASEYRELLATLRSSHDRLAASLGSLNDDQVSGDSYDDEWSIAQVASHLGSGAEIFEHFVTAGLTGAPSPGIDVLQPIWDVWNAKTPAEQAADAVDTDARFLSRLEGLTEDDHAGWQLELFGSVQSLADLLRRRLAEHAVHTWDIVVALDPTATVAGDAIALVIDQLPWLVERAGKGAEPPATVSVETSDPDRSLLLSLTKDGASLTPATADDRDANAKAQLKLPAEAFLRLVYGRLDPDHTPADVEADGIDLDTLRRSFPGF